jgi:hypothetical protein
MFTSTGLIGVAILLAFGGTLAASLYTMFALGIAGAPGALLGGLISRRSEKPTIPVSAFLLTAAGQTYATLAFAACVIQSTRSWIGDTTGLGKWVLWFVTLWVAAAPASLAMKESYYELRNPNEELSKSKKIAYYAASFTWPLTYIGVFIFIFFPRATSWGWGWVPHF